MKLLPALLLLFAGCSQPIRAPGPITIQYPPEDRDQLYAWAENQGFEVHEWPHAIYDETDTTATLTPR